MSRTISRENAFRTIYSKLFDTSLDGLEASSDINKKCDMEFYTLLCEKFVENKDMLTEKIKSKLKGITIERLYKLDLALIYLALTELEFLGTPSKVVINETVELAKSYSTDKSAKFINGFLAGFLS